MFTAAEPSQNSNTVGVVSMTKRYELFFLLRFLRIDQWNHGAFHSEKCRRAVGVMRFHWESLNRRVHSYSIVPLNELFQLQQMKQLLLSLLSIGFLRTSQNGVDACNLISISLLLTRSSTVSPRQPDSVLRDSSEKIVRCYLYDILSSENDFCRRSTGIASMRRFSLRSEKHQTLSCHRSQKTAGLEIQ